MDIGYTYGTSKSVTVSIYAPPGMEPPEQLDLTGPGGELIKAIRLSDRSLVCEPVETVVTVRGKQQAKSTGACRDYDCHRRNLGECGCGRHAGMSAPATDPRPRVRITRNAP